MRRKNYHGYLEVKVITHGATKAIAEDDRGRNNHRAWRRGSDGNWRGGSDAEENPESDRF